MSSIKIDTFRSYLIIFIGTHPVALSAGLEVQEADHLDTIGYTSAISSKLDGARFAQCLRSNVFLPCAYHRTTAVLTCLHIPMQLNIAYFLFPVLAPLLPIAPLPPAGL